MEKCPRNKESRAKVKFYPFLHRYDKRDLLIYYFDNFYKHYPLSLLNEVLL